MSDAGNVIEGVVLCRVGDDRLAVRAVELTGIEPADPAAPYAGLGFDPAARAPLEGKLLRGPDTALVVDTVEVHAERLTLLSVPGVLARAWGGSLTGFVVVAGALWPVISLARLQPAPELAS